MNFLFGIGTPGIVLIAFVRMYHNIHILCSAESLVTPRALTSHPFAYTFCFPNTDHVTILEDLNVCVVHCSLRASEHTLCPKGPT